MDDEQATHEAIARRTDHGFVATCSCGWAGAAYEDRRRASWDARKHEERPLWAPRGTSALVEESVWGGLHSRRGPRDTINFKALGDRR